MVSPRVGFSLFLVFLGNGSTGNEGAVTGTGKAGLSTGTIIGIVIAIFFILLIILDVSCYFMNQCGVLMCLCVNLCGKRPASTEEKQAVTKMTEMEEGTGYVCLPILHLQKCHVNILMQMFANDISDY